MMNAKTDYGAHPSDQAKPSMNLAEYEPELPANYGAPSIEQELKLPIESVGQASLVRP